MDDAWSSNGIHFNSPRAIIVTSNSLWNITNFRKNLILSLALHGYRPILAVPLGANEVAPLDLGVDITGIELDRAGLNPMRDFKLFSNFLRILARTKPVAVLGFTIKPNIYGALAARMAGVPFIPNVSGLGTAFLAGGLLSRFVSLLYKIAFRRCPVVFFQNPEDRNIFVTGGLVKRSQARLLPGSGIDLAYFYPPAATEHVADLSFLYVGRLVGDKGVREYVEAARLLRLELPGARFKLLGSLDAGNRTSIGPDELARWKAEGIVELLGQAEDVRPFIAAASAIVLPSYREGLPRSLLEGAAMARPLIATDEPGNREIVEDGVTGLMCQSRNAQSLADAMRRFAMLSSQQRAALGRAARAKAEARFSETIVIEAYLDALQQLMPVAG